MKARARIHKEPINRINEPIGELSAVAGTSIVAIHCAIKHQHQWIDDERKENRKIKTKKKKRHPQAIDQPIGYCEGDDDDADLWIRCPTLGIRGAKKLIA